MIEKEFDECLRLIVQLNYGLICISHSTDKTFIDENGVEYNQIVPTLDKRGTKIVSRLVDIIGYSKAVQKDDGSIITKLFMRGTPRYMAGSRFKFMPTSINFSYESLVEAIQEAINKEEEINDSNLFTDEINNLHVTEENELDFDDLINTFNNLIQTIAEQSEEGYFENYWQPRIVQITDKYLGKGNKVNECSRNQIEALDLIITDLKDLIQDSEE